MSNEEGNRSQAEGEVFWSEPFACELRAERLRPNVAFHRQHNRFDSLFSEICFGFEFCYLGFICYLGFEICYFGPIRSRNVIIKTTIYSKNLSKTL